MVLSKKSAREGGGQASSRGNMLNSFMSLRGVILFEFQRPTDTIFRRRIVLENILVFEKHSCKKKSSYVSDVLGWLNLARIFCRDLNLCWFELWATMA